MYVKHLPFRFFPSVWFLWFCTLKLALILNLNPIQSTRKHLLCHLNKETHSFFFFFFFSLIYFYFIFLKKSMVCLWKVFCFFCRTCNLGMEEFCKAWFFFFFLNIKLSFSSCVFVVFSLHIIWRLYTIKTQQQYYIRP